MDNQQQNRNFKYRGHVLDKSCLQDIYNKYINGESLLQLSKFYGYDISTIKNFLETNGVKIRTRKESMIKFHKTKTINIDQFLHESIIGWLLGDGGMTIKKRGINPIFNYTDSHYEYIKYVYDILTKYGIHCKISEYKSRNCYKLITESLPQFHEYYNLFYGVDCFDTYGRKIKYFPDITLTPTILKNWYIGDVCSSRQGKKKVHRAIIVNKCKNEFVLDQLNKITGSCKCYPRATCYTYNFCNRSLINLLEYIGECPVECYKYKWITRCSTTIIETS